MTAEIDAKAEWAAINAQPIGTLKYEPRYEPVKRSKRQRRIPGLKGYSFEGGGVLVGPRGPMKPQPGLDGGEERYHIRREGRRWFTRSELLARLK
jgi:hypothetical protein